CSALMRPLALPSSFGPQLLLDTWVITPSGCHARATPAASSGVLPAISRRPIILASGATPVTPMLLNPVAAARPAHLVPWESVVLRGVGSFGGPSLKLRW